MSNSIFKIAVKWPRVNNGLINRIICFAVTVGVVPPDILEDDFNFKGVSEEAIELSKKFDDFGSVLKAVPPFGDKQRELIVEENNRQIWIYAKTQYALKLRGKVDGFRADSDQLFNISSYGTSGSSKPYSVALVNCRKVFSRKPYGLFWDSIGARVQSFREKDQLVPAGLGISISEYESIKPQMEYVARGFAYNAKTTQSKDYITGTPVAQKIEDSEAFSTWYKTKTPTLVKIIRLTMTDIPLSYALKEVQNFELDPNSESARKLLQFKLLELQREGLAALRKAQADAKGEVFNFETWLNSK